MIVSHFIREGWATCPSGHFIRGLHRGGGHELNSIQWVTCCKPAMHPHWYKQCYDQDVSGDTLECNRNGFYVAGIHRGASQKLSSINQLRCCNMYDGTYFTLKYSGGLMYGLFVGLVGPLPWMSSMCFVLKKKQFIISVPLFS